MHLDKNEVKANCSLYEDKNQNDDIKKVLMSCYIELSEEICKSDDLSYYDLIIDTNVDGKRTVSDISQDIILKGFDGQRTITILPGKIEEKYNENNKFIFILKNNTIPESLKDNNFLLNFYTSEESEAYEAKCLFEEENNIKCEIENDLLSIDNDIIIKENPSFILLNNRAVYFEKFENLRTFHIKAGQIQKTKCSEGKDYQFNILNILSSENIPEEKEIEIKVKINNEDEELKTAICTIKSSSKYNMKCIIKDIYCPKDIILLNENNYTDTELFSPNIIYFYDFNDKRTISIIAGKLNKGNCHYIGDNKQQYSFTFTNNEFTY